MLAVPIPLGQRGNGTEVSRDQLQVFPRFPYLDTNRGRERGSVSDAVPRAEREVKCVGSQVESTCFSSQRKEEAISSV